MSHGTDLLEMVRRRLAEAGAEPTPARVAVALREQGRLLGDAEVLGVVAALRSEMVGSGPLEPLLAAPDVTDVLVTAPDEVWVDRGGGLERTDVRFRDAAEVRRLAQRLAAVAGRRLDDARPWVDARLPDGTRLHAVLPRWPSPGPVCPYGCCGRGPSASRSWWRPARSRRVATGCSGRCWRPGCLS